jgi:hypothetical protein
MQAAVVAERVTPMDLTQALPQDEQFLAQLTTPKLAKVMHGFLSVATTSLQMESPADFLGGREKTGLGFLEVLRCVGVKPGHADKIEFLRQRVDQLSELGRRFHGLFLELAGWRSMSPQDIRITVERLGDTYAQFCQLLGTFRSELGADSDYSAQARQDRDMLDAFLPTLAAQ